MSFYKDVLGIKITVKVYMPLKETKPKKKLKFFFPEKKEICMYVCMYVCSYLSINRDVDRYMHAYRDIDW